MLSGAALRRDREADGVATQGMMGRGSGVLVGVSPIEAGRAVVGEPAERPPLHVLGGR